MDNIGGIPSDILSKSFPGVHHGLFRFLFRADPVIRLTRIRGSWNKEIVKPEVESVSLSYSVQNVQIIPLESEVKVEVIEPEGSKREAPEEILGLNLGEGISEPEVKSEIISAQNNIILEEVELKTEVKPEEENLEILKLPQKVQIKSESNFPFGFPSIEEAPFVQNYDEDASNSYSSRYTLRQRKVLRYTDTIEIDMSNSGSDSDLSEDASSEDVSTKREASEEEPDDAEEDFNHDLYKCKSETSEAKKASKSTVLNLIQASNEPRIELTCEICSKTLSSRARLFQHMKCVHTKGPFKCLEKNCDKIFQKVDYLKIHTNENHKASQTPIICKHCPPANQYIYKSKIRLNEHILRTHREIKKFSIKCTFGNCKRTFRNESFLQRHLVVHSFTERTRNYICQSCGKTYFTGHELRKHRNVYHNPQMDGQVHKCSDCDRQFSKYSSFVHHRRKKFCRPSHQCPHCNLLFPLAGQLKDHENIHTKEFQYECDHCTLEYFIQKER